MTDRSTLKALTFGILAAFFWGTHSVIVRYLTTDLSGLTIAALRLYIAAFILFLIMKANRRPVRFDLTDRNFLITVVGSTTNYIFFHIGLEHTTASNAMVRPAPLQTTCCCLFCLAPSRPRLPTISGTRQQRVSRQSQLRCFSRFQ
jgi:drug/metabolite transporter (DMT)-like permease